MITHMNGDYFVDCEFASQSFLRAAFGVWIHIYAAVVAYCVRSIFRSRLITRLLSSDSRNRKVSLWITSPATTPSEIFQLRGILFRGLRRGHFSYVTVSLFCIAAAIVSAASTTIANHTVVRHLVIRRTDVPGRLAHYSPTLSGLYDRVLERAQALDHAQAPYDQLFDFIPDDDTNWVFSQEEWNNTWLGDCAFHKYPAVDLVVLSTNVSNNYQDLVPALGTVLPSWATLDPEKQGAAGIHSSGPTTNLTGVWRDSLWTYVFGSAPYAGNESLQTVNISFANFLIHDVGRGNGTMYMETAFKSDVYVVECTFNNTSLNLDQPRADEGQYDTVATTLVNMYTTLVAETSAQGGSVVQPTAQEMLRYWQAFQMVESGFYPYPVQRKLSVSLEMVQFRLSTVAATVMTFVLALAAAAVARFKEPVDDHGEHLTLPKSQLDWIVEAAHQRYGEGEYKSRIDYAKEREDLFYVVSTAREGLSRTQITSNIEKPITKPFLDYFDPYSLYDNSGEVSTISAAYDRGKPTTQSSVLLRSPFSVP